MMRVTDRWAYVLLLVGVWLWGAPAAAQEVTLRGFIVDRSDGQPLPGANVALQKVQDPQQQYVRRRSTHGGRWPRSQRRRQRRNG